jgi:hypothetical protein
MNFLLQSHIKALIDMSPVDSEENLFAHIAEAAAAIRQLPGIFERISVFASSSAVYQGRWPYI